MKVIRETQQLYTRNLKKTLSSPMWLFLRMLQPVLYLLLYMPLLRNLGNESVPTEQVVQIFVPGMLIIMAISTLFVGFSFVSEIRDGYVTRILVTPINRYSFLVGQILNDLTVLLIQVSILLVIAGLLGLSVTLEGLILSLVLVSMIGITMSSFSYVISIITKSEDGLAATVNTFFLPILLLSGILLPIALAPQWLQNLARLNPFYYAVEGVRALFLGDFSNDFVWQAFLIMGLFTIIAIWASTRTLKRLTA